MDRVNAVVVDNHEVVTSCGLRQRTSVIGPVPVTQLDAQPHILEGSALKGCSCPLLWYTSAKDSTNQ
jgi:hypothetical protein